MKSLLGLVQGAPCRIDVEFKDVEGKTYSKTASVKAKKDEMEEVPVYTNKDSVLGEVRVTPLTTKKLEHQGIKVQLLGQIELASERGTSHEFVSLVRELAPPGDLNTTRVFPFEFKSVELQYDSYRGQQVRCRYLLRVTVTGKGITPDSRRDFNMWVTNYELPEEGYQPIKTEVGIEECLHIEFEYDKPRYHLQDVVLGRIYFLLVRIKLKHMEIEIRRKETTGAGTAAHSEVETLAKYEIMDGAPVRGETVPIRLYLSPYELAPTYRDVHNKFSVRYFLNLVLVDEEDRRYFKQQEITLFRTLPEAGGRVAGPPPKLVPSSYPVARQGSSSNGAAAGAGSQPTSPVLASTTPVAPPPAAPSPVEASVSTPLGSTTSTTTAAAAPAPAAVKQEATSAAPAAPAVPVSAPPLAVPDSKPVEVKTSDAPLVVPEPEPETAGNGKLGQAEEDGLTFGDEPVKQEEEEEEGKQPEGIL